MGGLIQGGSTTIPRGATPVNSSSGNVANAGCSATIGSFFDTPYLTGFELTGGGATAASTIAVTITGLVGGTVTYEIVIPAGVNTQVAVFLEFSVPLVGNAGANIVVSVPAFGAGNLNAAVVAHGYHV